MKSLFVQSDNRDMVARIRQLDPAMKPQWGKMLAPQMLAHARQPLLVALGELKLKRSIPGILFGALARRKLSSETEQFPKNSPTDKAFIVTGDRQFEEERRALVALVERFAQTGPDSLTREPHPFFGKLTVREWDVLMWKHLDHHLRQFGV